ncbi:MAG: TonB-dependent receptor [Flavobacterium sp.]
MKKIVFSPNYFWRSMLVLVAFPNFFFAQIKEKDTTKLEEVIVSAVRVTNEIPITFSNLRKEEISKRNLGVDVPILMNFLPAVVTTSDAGAGIGYTGIRVRGSDATRVNVTLNGVPYNDPESQGTFWVNLVDLASSTESIQLQRGVGTSTNGAGAFGASIHLSTDGFSEKGYAEVNNSFGSFNTRKHTVKVSTGLLKDKWEFSARLSQINSDGYIDRASVDMKGYFLQGTYKGKTSLVKAMTFGGKQITYQAWYGLEDFDKRMNNRTYNVAGLYFDENGNEQFYDNEVDNYQQDHYQLHWNEKWNHRWSSNVALHYTIGKGYFEQYRQNQRFSNYGLTPITIGAETIDKTDLIRRRWLDNDFWGTTYSIQYKNEQTNMLFGGSLNRYLGAHFGEIIWARFASQSEIRDRYYDDLSTKNDFNNFVKVNHKLGEKWSLFGDLQFRYVRFTANGNETGLVNDHFRFWNPKAGLTYAVNDYQQLYFSYAKAQREPNRNDYENGNPRPEKLNDFELGWRWQKGINKLSANVYYMRYQDQLVLTGALNDVGAPLRENVGDSYRLGLEIDGLFQLSEKWFWQPNIALSQNKNLDFIFERDGQLINLGNTNIAFSPNLIAGNQIRFQPNENLYVNLLSKYVSKQYMGNIDSNNSVLPSYHTHDLNVGYAWQPKNWVEKIEVSLLVQNLFNRMYESNGYFYTFNDDYSVPGQITTIEGAGFYPQAGTNFLLGLNMRF